MTVRERMRRRGWKQLAFGLFERQCSGLLVRIASAANQWITGRAVVCVWNAEAGRRVSFGCDNHGLPDLAQRARAAARKLAKGKR